VPVLTPHYRTPAVNKWDLVKDDGRGEAVLSELSDLLGCAPTDILRISAKTGWGVESVLDAVVERIPPPLPRTSLEAAREPFRGLVFDSWYDSFRGVVSLVSVFEGEVKKGALAVSPPLLSVAPRPARTLTCLLPLLFLPRPRRRLDHVDHHGQRLHGARPGHPLASRDQHRRPPGR